MVLSRLVGMRGGLGLGRVHRDGGVRRLLGRIGLLLCDFQRIDAVQHADDRLLHRIQHAGVVLVVVAPLVDEAFEHAANLADVARLYSRSSRSANRAAAFCAAALAISSRSVVRTAFWLMRSARRSCESWPAMVASCAADLLKPGGIAVCAHAVGEEPRHPLVRKLGGERAQMRVDGIEADELAPELVELVADLLDLRLREAQLVEVGARRHAAERRGHARLELVEAAAERQQRVAGVHLSERLLDAHRDLGEGDGRARRARWWKGWLARGAARCARRPTTARSNPPEYPARRSAALRR